MAITRKTIDDITEAVSTSMDAITASENLHDLDLGEVFRTDLFYLDTIDYGNHERPGVFSVEGTDNRGGEVIITLQIVKIETEDGVTQIEGVDFA